MVATGYLAPVATGGSITMKEKLKGVNKMDPTAAWKLWAAAQTETEAAEAAEDLHEWLGSGGFEPRWTKEQALKFVQRAGSPWEAMQ
jgi:hypothetical protein